MHTLPTTLSVTLLTGALVYPMAATVIQEVATVQAGARTLTETQPPTGSTV